ncbi:hypothetical protein ALC62_11475 [Cyphomyrmex costatus]|uniref:Uncharacterized protein n=1 Tax=Cyphomyrmex costatus TaxID=456900 RepID=A0A151ICN9_9HYME|nr:hypothetical protein ALC62_11475 [Cyphomyrmex costatus]
MPKLHTDRCCNPYGKIGHRGKNLRFLSDNFKKTFPNLSRTAKICSTCRLSNNKKENDTVRSKANSNHSFDNNISIDCNVRSPREIELEGLMDDIKQKFSNLDANDPNRLLLLTIHPVTWSIRKIATEFNCSRRMTQRAKQMRELNGVLSSPTPKKGAPLSNSIIEKVHEFYNSDANSRIMPGIKDVISVKVDDVRKKMQKRLLLSDLKGLFSKYKEENQGFLLSFSKFAQLRPKHCILMGAAGTHSVCVCTLHQNVKLMLDVKYLSQ